MVILIYTPCQEWSLGLRIHPPWSRGGVLDVVITDPWPIGMGRVKDAKSGSRVGREVKSSRVVRVAAAAAVGHRHHQN